MSLFLDKAIKFAVRAHDGSLRKGTDLPYISHPYAVGMILARAGCSEEVIAAGILHDTVEDTPVTLEQIQEEFGDDVMELVKGASEPDKSLSWEDRKRHTLEYLKTAPLDIKCLGCADKLHNAWSIIQDLQTHGESVWDRFKRGKDQQLWYYKGVYESLIDGVDAEDRPQIFEDYQKAVQLLEAL